MSTTILLTINAAAEALSVSARTVRRLLDRGDLSTIRIGRTVRVSAADMADYVARQITPSDTQAGTAAKETSTCQDDKSETRTASSSGRTRLSGGPRRRTVPT